jgi:hypothetical protein
MQYMISNLMTKSSVIVSALKRKTSAIAGIGLEHPKADGHGHLLTRPWSHRVVSFTLAP